MIFSSKSDNTLQHTAFTFKVFHIIAMIYATISIASMVVAFKVVSIKGFIFTGSALIMPFRYLMGDIIAEVYGFYMAKKMIWTLILCWYIFSLLAIAIIHLPSPSYWSHQAAFNLVLGSTIKTVTATLIAVIIGSNLNIYVLSRWKQAVRGRFFSIRCICCAGIGELTQYAIALPIMYYSLLSAERITKLVAFDFLTQLISIVILATPSQLITYAIKKIEKMDVYDLLSFPFSISASCLDT